VVGVSYDSNADNKAFKDKFDFPYDLLSDADKSASAAYGIVDNEKGNPTRASVLIAPDGTVVRAYDMVVPVEHPDQVLADLGNF
jgi:peroxiredoxin Q/BCP